MLKEVQVAAFEGGSLRVFATGEKGREAVLALPLNRLIAKMVRVPADQDPIAFSTPILKDLSPYPDEPLTVSCETVAESADGKVVIAAALPESSTDDIAEALDAAKLNVTRIDALEFGALRGLWPQIDVADASHVGTSRRVVLLEGLDCVSLIVLDGDRPSAIRAITDVGELKREVTLSLLEAEDFGGGLELKEILVVKRDRSDESDKNDESALDPQATPDTQVNPPDPFAALSAFAPLRELTIGRDAALVGVAERSEEAGSLDASPESWKEVLAETRFKAKMVKYLAIAGGVWLLIMAVLFGVPMVYGFMTDYQKGLCKEHRRQYEAVKAMKGKVDLVRKYSDHARGALEIMKALSDNLPEGIELNSWSYRREDGVRVSGEADSANDVYAFKDKMIELADEGGDRVFGAVELIGPSAGKGGKQKFDIECRYQGEEDE